jgi:hypothetical protein
MCNLSRIGIATSYVCSFIVFFVAPLVAQGPPPTATGHFEVYCDGVGIFLTKIDDAPPSGKLVLFFSVSFPSGTMGGLYIGQGKWSDTYALPDRCVPDGKCASIAEGKVWIDALEAADTTPKRISGKYKIDLNGRHLEGAFLVRRHDRKYPLRLCM